MIFKSYNSLFTVEHRKHSKCLNSKIFSISRKRLAHREFDGVVTTSRREFTVPSTNAGQSFFMQSREILEDMDTTSSGLKSSATINSFYQHTSDKKSWWSHCNHQLFWWSQCDHLWWHGGFFESMELVACAFRKAPSVLKGKYTFYGPIQVTSFFREGLAYWTQN